MGKRGRGKRGRGMRGSGSNGKLKRSSVRLLAVSRGARSQFAHRGQKSFSSARVRQVVECYSRGKLGRSRMKLHSQNVLLARRHQGIQLRRRIFLPVRAGRQHHRPRLVYVPHPLIALGSRNSAAACAPAMAYDFQMEVRRSAQVGFKCQRLFLLVPAAQKPLHRKSSRTKLHGDVRIFKAAGRELQARVEA